MLRYLITMMAVLCLLMLVVPFAFVAAGDPINSDASADYLSIAYLIAFIVPLSIYSARTLDFILNGFGARFANAEYRASTLRLKRIVRVIQVLTVAGIADLLLWVFFSDIRTASLLLLLALRVLECFGAYLSLRMVTPHSDSARPTVITRGHDNVYALQGSPSHKKNAVALSPKAAISRPAAYADVSQGAEARQSVSPPISPQRPSMQAWVPTAAVSAPA